MHGAQELPFTSPHLRTGCRGTGRIVEKKPNDNVVAFVYQETAEFVEPEGAVHTFRLCGNEDGGLACNGNDVLAFSGLGVVMVKSFEVFLKLKGGIEL
jgi:hypothetical protein